MARSTWIALSLAALTALAACSPVPRQPPMAPAPPPPPAVAEAPTPPEAPPAPPGPPSAGSDQEFINLATGMNASEIGMGRLAEGKGASREIRIFAKHMVIEHIQMNRRLALLAKRLQLTVTPPPDEPPPDLLTSIGPQFDRHYVDLVTAGHQNMIALFEGEAANGQDPHAKALARELLPALRYQLHAVDDLGHKAGV